MIFFKNTVSSNRQTSETFRLGGLLAVVGGFLDAYTYLIRGGVFANAQTGNIVLLGISLANGAFYKAFFYMIPITAFIGGILCVEKIKTRMKVYAKVSIHWRQIVVFLEGIILLPIAFIPKGTCDPLVNILISFVCSLQVESFRKIHGNSFATTMCTGNLRSMTELLYRAQTRNEEHLRLKSLHYLGVILAFILGAAAGTVLTHYWKERSILLCVGILGVTFLYMYWSQVDSVD